MGKKPGKKKTKAQKKAAKEAKLAAAALAKKAEKKNRKTAEIGDPSPLPPEEDLEFTLKPPERIDKTGISVGEEDEQPLVTTYTLQELVQIAEDEYDTAGKGSEVYDWWRVNPDYSWEFCGHYGNAYPGENKSWETLAEELLESVGRNERTLVNLSIEAFRDPSKKTILEEKIRYLIMGIISMDPAEVFGLSEMGYTTSSRYWEGSTTTFSSGTRHDASSLVISGGVFFTQ